MGVEKRSAFKMTVAVSCYNHGPFLGRLLESIYSQKTNFPFKVIIGNDASIDNTKEIIDSYKQQYPEQTEVLHHEKNKGVMGLVLSLADMVEGEYLAITDGDDYWSYDGKLQKQVEYLDANPEYNGCFHDVKIVNRLDTETDNLEVLHSQSKVFYKSYSQIYNFKPDIFSSDIIERLIIPTSGLMVRYNYNLKKELATFPDTRLSFGWLLQLLHIKGSKFRFINEVWTEYNDNSGGVTKRFPHSRFTESNIRVLKALLKHPAYSQESRGIYSSLFKEYGYLLFNKIDMTWAERRKYNFLYWYYGQRTMRNNMNVAAKN